MNIVLYRRREYAATCYDKEVSYGFDYTGAVQSVVLKKGTYKLQCWGAQGGTGIYQSSSMCTGGNGGYSEGTLTLESKQKLYVYVGGAGGSNISGVIGGFNGGGNAGTSSSSYSTSRGGGGGGASDIRIAQDSIYARVIVAGGGGGGGVYTTVNGYTAGAGGGTTGIQATATSGYLNRCSTPGTQTSGGGNGSSSEAEGATVGSFGQGGNGAGTNGADVAGGAGGGGGWYGAGGANYGRAYAGAGSGGSGYVYKSDTASNYPSGCLLNSSYYLESASTVAGNTSFVSVGGGTETGHTGNGYVRISGIEYECNQQPFKPIVYDFNYTGSYTAMTLDAGTYNLQCWGAQGGYGNDSSYIGKGGYSEGTLTLGTSTTVYVYVGGQGSRASGTTLIAGGYNGGGSGYTGSNNDGFCGSGGGASDIRIGSTSLYARVIVAGGGGGSGSWSTSGYEVQGGYGGGTSGGNATIMAGSSQTNGSGGTQTAGGGGYTTGSFGQGANRTNSGSSGGGGGGGWYGGGAGVTNGAGGGGGSGYIHQGTNSESSLGANYILSNASTIAGDTSFESVNGGTETGHAGNGHVRITRTA